MDDESIIALYWQRDQRAITETDTKYGALCRTVASGILRDREDTEECVSDAYLAAWNAIPPRRPQRFRAYICTVVRNISVSRVREKCLKRRGGGEYPAALDELDECTAGSGSDPAAGLGLDSSLTVGEYAQSKGLTLMWIGAGIKYGGALDINSQSIDYRFVSDGVIDVMISAVTNTAADDMDFTLDLSAHRGGADGVARRELNVKLKNGALSEERSYVPSGSGAIPGINAAVISAAVTQTDVETYLEIRCTRGAAVMEALDSEGLSFRIYAADGTELPSSSGSGALEPDENGEYVTGYVLYKCDPGESFTLEAFNCWEKNVYGRIEMKAG